MSHIGLNLGHNASAFSALGPNKFFGIEEERLSRVRFYEDGSHFIYSCNGRPRIVKKPVGQRGMIYILRELCREEEHLINVSEKSQEECSKNRRKKFWQEKIRDSVKIIAHSEKSHHFLHLQSTFRASNFDSAAILTIDGSGIGEGGIYETATGWLAYNGNYEKIFSVAMPHSLGNLYFLAGIHAGLGDNPEGKLMALASYGDKEDEIALYDLLILEEGGGFSFVNGFFKGELPKRAGLSAGLGDWLVQRYGQHRDPAFPVDSRQIALARGVQGLVNRAVAHMAANLFSVARKKLGPEPKLCMAGGVALNTVANKVAYDSGDWGGLFIQPGAYDGGLAAGLAFWGGKGQTAKKMEDIFAVGFSGRERAEQRAKSFVFNRKTRALGESKKPLDKRRLKSIIRWHILGLMQEAGKLERAKKHDAAVKLLCKIGDIKHLYSHFVQDIRQNLREKADCSKYNDNCFGKIPDCSDYERLYAEYLGKEKRGSNFCELAGLYKIYSRKEGKKLDFYSFFDRICRANSEIKLEKGDKKGAFNDYLLMEEINPGSCLELAGFLAKELGFYKQAVGLLRKAVIIGQGGPEKRDELLANLSFSQKACKM